MRCSVNWLLPLSLTLVVACGALLDIQDAETDPLLIGNVGGQGAGGDGTGGDTTAPLCDTYCALVQSNCVDETQVYASQDLCLRVCGFLPDGMEGDMSGNTVGCRTTNARAAEATGEPDVHCPIAGPGGDGTCGSNCEAYCSLMQQVCAARFGMDYDGIPDCIDQCTNDVPDIGNYSSNIQEGDSIQCRLYHVSAATFDPGQHCAHAAGDAPCLDSGVGGAGGS